MLDDYAKRAPEYERIHAKPGRQGDLTEAMTHARSIAGAEYKDADEHGNTWQRRPLQDGAEHDVLKHLTDNSTLLQAVTDITKDVRVNRLQYDWTLEYLTN